jgi:cation/acetate symporter
MSVEAVTLLLVALTFAMYIYIGYASRVSDTKGFYVAGQGVPPVANGAATAADWMSAASFISMAGMIAFMGFDGTIYLMGWTGGYVLLALLLAPYLRKFGRYTVPDFIGDRFYSKWARAVAAIATIFISVTYVAGQMRGVGIVFSRYLQIEIVYGVLIGMAIVAFFATMGGMKGITWTQAAQYAVLIIAYVIPAVAIAWILTGNPIPQLALTFSDIAARLSALTIEVGMTEYLQPFTNMSMINVFAVTLALMIGTAGLPHVIIRFYTVPNVRGARYSAGWALLFIALLYTTAPALAVFAQYNLTSTLQGKTFAEVRELDWVNKWEASNLLQFDESKGEVISVAGPNQNVNIDRDIIVLSTPEVAQLAPFVIGLVAAGGLAAALSTASGLLLAMSSAVSHDLYFRIFRPGASERQRLKVARISILGFVIISGWFGINPPGYVSEIVAFAFGLAAASLFPAILMGIFDKRMNKEGAITGIVAGLVFTFTMIVLMRSVPLLGTAKPMVDSFFGINAQGVGIVGAALHFIAAYVVSRMTPPPPQDIQELVENIRIPSGVGKALDH